MAEGSEQGFNESTDSCLAALIVIVRKEKKKFTFLKNEALVVLKPPGP